MARLSEGLGLGFAPLGYHPTLTRAAASWMPKGRYAIMRRYMPLVGGMGLDMMLRTCTVQVNLDYADEADMRRKLRVSLALQPLATALFANSPFKEGRPNGLLSNRAHVWTDVDGDRTGMPALMFEEDFGFERFTGWLLDVPMYFIQRDGRYLDMAGRSFRAFMAGRLRDAVPHRATLGDWADHVTTAFTDVRLKRFLEMRGADAGSPAMMLALSAFWVGLLYDDAALAAAEALVRAHPHGGLHRAAPAGATQRDGDAVGHGHAARPGARCAGDCGRRPAGAGPPRGRGRRVRRARPAAGDRAGRANAGRAVARTATRPRGAGIVNEIFLEADIKGYS